MEFKIIELKDAKIDILDGDRGKNYPKKTEMSNQGHTLFLNNKNIINDYLDVTTGEFITEYKSNELRKGKLIRDDIVMSTRGSVGNIGHYSEDIALNNIRINSGMVILRNKNVKINTKYLYILLKSSYMKKQYLELISGSVQNQLPIRDLQHIKLRIPQLIYQKKIVQIINNLEQKIFFNRKIISNLEKLSQTLFKHWFIDFEFPNEEGKPYKSSGGEMMESELGEIPKGWVSSNISEVCLLNKGSYSKKDEWSCINYLDTSSITNNSISNIQLINVQKEKVPSRAKRKLLPNDIVYSTVRPNQYHYGLIKNPLTNMVASTGFTVIRSSSEYPNDLIYMWLTQKEVTQHLQSVAEQSTSAYPSIKANDIGQLKILIPPKKLIDKLNDIISNNHNQIWGYQQENKKLSELRDTLLPKLLSGEIEIPDDLEV